MAPRAVPPKPPVKASAAAVSQLEQLAAEFAPEEHKNRSQGGTQLTYISIDATINRLNAVLGTGWSTSAVTDLTATESGYLAKCELTLSTEIDGTSKFAYGVGAMVNKDPDMAAKTALAEALKKAGHQLGIGLYLWDPVARDNVNRKSKLAKASAATLKGEVFKLAQEQLGKDKPTAAEIGKLFNVAPGNLADTDTLREILKAQGLL